MCRLKQNIKENKQHLDNFHITTVSIIPTKTGKISSIQCSLQQLNKLKWQPPTHLISKENANTVLYWHCPDSMQSMVYATFRRLSHMTTAAAVVGVVAMRYRSIDRCMAKLAVSSSHDAAAGCGLCHAVS